MTALGFSILHTQPSVQPSALARFAHNHVRGVASVTAVFVLLTLICLVRTYGPASGGLVLGPIAAGLLVAFCRHRGLSWSDLGLSRRHWARGAAYAGAAVALVAVVYAIAAVVPFTRMAFADVRYEMPMPRALLTAFVFIPLGTVLVEELAFRGVLLGLVTRHWGHRWGITLSSVTFGAWHVLPSLGLSHANAAMHALAGGQIGSVLAAVAFTAVAGFLLAALRRRSGSILASAGLHWAVNALGVLATAFLFAATRH